MNVHEHLLSKDPMGAFEKIREDYLRYFKTMYRFKNRDLDIKKNDELLEHDNLFKEPICELTPKYVSENADLVDLCDPNSGSYKYPNELIPLPTSFEDFIARGMMRDDRRTQERGRFATYNPYVHQFEMLCKGYGEGKNILITSGTGSGKTESFMLPLLASLLNEARTWADNTHPYYNPSWWQELDDPHNPESRYRPNQRENEDNNSRPAAIRALLLYPMNALVADQVSRLRKALDSDAVREYLDNECNGHRIFFGSYNGSTLKQVTTINGKNSHALLEEIAQQSSSLQNALNQGECEPDDIYVAPRLDDNSFTGEMLIREDMYDHAPDIMITNVSMLSIMLMRAEEQRMLDQTRDYYSNNPNAVFHLIVDELHLQRGTAGAEVAYLLRMFLNRIGVPPMKNGRRNPQLRIYASSASISEANQYLEDFFGVYDQNDQFAIQEGYDVLPNTARVRELNYRQFDIFYLNNHCGLPYYEQLAHDNDPDNTNEPRLAPQTERAFLNSINYNGTFQEFIEDYSETIYNDLLTVAGAKWNDERFKESPHTFAVSELAGLPGNPTDDAIRGFLIFRGAVKHDLLPSIRFHQFYKYIEGLWGELLPDGDGNGPIGELMFQPKEVSSNGQHKMLELLRCECCGELFIGGNRMQMAYNQIGMSLNDPNLERIPNMQATPMVQRKELSEYLLFWPSRRPAVNGFYSSDPQTGNYDRFGLVNVIGGQGGRTRDENGTNNHHGAWTEGYLNTCDGSISDNVNPQIRSRYIHGFYYYPRNSQGQPCTTYREQALKALPCKCPACNKDYRTRLYTQSPIRSFRTGMGRNNQLLSKEILYQLDPIRNHKPKLIGFSDSRQDAAEQSKLIAREHYRDMLRLAFVRIIESKINGGVPPQLQTTKDSIVALLNANLPSQNIIAIIDTSQLSTTDKNALRDIVNSNVPTQQKVLDVNAYTPRFDIIDLDEMICAHVLPGQNPNINGELVQALLELGINPAGSDYADNYPFGNEYWDHRYDFTLRTMLPGEPNWFFNRVYNNLQANIFSNCFGQYMNVNTEVAGLGYVMPANIDGLAEVNQLRDYLQPYLTQNGLSIEGVLSSLIRIYGDNYRYDGDFDADPMRNYGEFKKPIAKVIEHLANLLANVRNNVDENELGRLVNAAMQRIATDQNGNIDISKPLRFKLSHATDSYYECPGCRRIHLHRGLGFCTNTACLAELPLIPQGQVGVRHNPDEVIPWDNYISYDVMVEPHNAKRLHSEELTGQTDNQTDRLLMFKDIIVDPNANADTNQIDMLCVTTTMEVGVDIGSLQAIYQGNMPPTRYNYQQRVGRAGRRGQAFSAALTFCRGRSHDNHYYYDATKEMTGGRPADPTLSVNPRVGESDNLIIIKRIILKHLLMLISSDKILWSTNGTCGQLGGTKAIPQPVNWTTEVLPEIERWIRANQAEVERVIHFYLDQYYPANANVFGEILDWINNEVIGEMNTAVGGDNQEDNAKAIAEAGLLPMYGMPISIRNLYHHGTRSGIRNHQFEEKYDGMIDRPVEQAIAEFAPGAMKTKDSAEYVSAGLTIPMDYTPLCRDDNDLAEKREQLDPLQYSYNLELSGEDIVNIRPYDRQEIDANRTNVFRVVIPKAFRTDKVIDNKGESRPEDDSKSNFMPVSVWVDARSTSPQQIDGGAAKWEVWNGLHQRGDVWYVNLNYGRLFEGVKAINTVADRNNQEYTTETHFYTGVINDRNRQMHILQYSPNFMVRYHGQNRWVVDERSRERIAIGAKKVTDILSLSLDINRIPTCLCLNANENGNKSAIIAAFYSAATLIQRAFASSIDISPEEIEISEVKIDPVNGLPSVYLNDKAPNGAGFISLLTSIDPSTGNLRLVDIMRDIVSPNPQSTFIRSILNHMECKTSCPKCLNTFYNRGLHHVLDWRLGMDVIKLMLDSTYTMGYNDLRETPYGDLAGLLNELGERVQNAHPAGNVVYTPNNGTDWHTGFFTCIDDNNHRCVEHLVHPLWNVSQQEAADGYKAQSMFKLQRNVKQAPQIAPNQPTIAPTVNNTPQPYNTQQTPAGGNAGCGDLG